MEKVLVGVWRGRADLAETELGSIADGFRLARCAGTAVNSDSKTDQ